MTIFLNEPENYNAISPDILKGLGDALIEARNDPDVRAIVLAGKGKGFCAGGDMKRMGVPASPALNKRRLDNNFQVVKLLQSVPKPVICAVHGHAAGAGFSIALACDIIIAEEDAKFNLAFAKIAYIPDYGAHFFLTKILGPWKARQLIWSAAAITAAEGEKYGFVNEVTKKGEALTVAREWAQRLAAGPGLAYGFSKDLVMRSLTSTLDEIAELENYSQSMLKLTEDHKEAVQAFKEKRPPRFFGK